jgi:hypothetical protein
MTEVTKVLLKAGASLSTVNTKVTMVLVEAGPSRSAVDNDVIKPSVKLIQSNIKLFK